jgi:ABC-2 type transport system ATP-binding protein
MISLRNVEKRFGRVEAVRGVSLHVEKGEIVGILGPNGAGKSTTVRMIASAIPPTSGRVEVAGADSVEQSQEVRRKTGYMPESSPLYREMRVGSLLNYRAGLFGLRGRAKKDAIRRAAGQCQLEGVIRRRCGDLSKGYRQRVGLASVLLHDPEVLILDEPTSGLDPSQIAETRGLIRRLAGKRTMLIVSHILPEVERSCSRIILFAGGRVHADGSPADLARRLSGNVNEYRVEARAEGGARTAAAWNRIEGFERAETEDLAEGWTRFGLTFRADAGDRREAIARTAAGGGLLVREISRRSPSLEDLYLRLIASDSASSGGSS